MRNRSVTHFSSSSAFHALSDPTRRALLDLLRTRGTQAAGEVAESFPVSRPAISKHLQVLRRAHLVHEHRRGRHRLYQLNPEPLRAVDSWLSSYRALWSSRLSDLKQYVEQNPEQHSRPSKHEINSQRRKRRVKATAKA